MPLGPGAKGEPEEVAPEPEEQPEELVEHEEKPSRLFGGLTS